MLGHLWDRHVTTAKIEQLNAGMAHCLAGRIVQLFGVQ